MNPALSVIVFTVLSGAGYGLWFFLGLSAFINPLPRSAALAALIGGFVLVSIGLISSTAHLGQPQRAWRAFSQWRSSWLSREGIAAVLCFLPAVWIGLQLWRSEDIGRIAGLSLMAMSLVTVLCTAMIYHSLKPIPAWRHPLVPIVYLLFALLMGRLLFLALQASAGGVTPDGSAFMLILSCAVLGLAKQWYWKDISRLKLGALRAEALGLPVGSEVKVFERPHTEANYLTREMGFVLARKHAVVLRRISLLLFAVMPALLMLPILLSAHADAAIWLSAAACSVLVGAFGERWLFFAEARHVVAVYY